MSIEDQPIKPLNPSINKIRQDSRQVKPGDLFVAIRGILDDGRKYIAKAIENGATAVLCEVDREDDKCHGSSETECQPSSGWQPAQNQNIIPYSNLRDAMGFIASRFYDNPSAKLKLIGITGTNGKTSCTHFIAQLLAELNIICGVMGTLGNGLLNTLIDFQSTTSDAITTHEELKKIVDQKATVAAMEVTSHALIQKRVNGLHFHSVAFTNLTRDHLDYHDSMEEYYLAKKRLFTDFKSSFKIINLDDEYGRRLWRECSIPSKNPQSINKNEWIGYTINPNFKKDYSELLALSSFDMMNNIISVEETRLDSQGIHAKINSPWGKGNLHCALLGHFNLSNILASLACLCVQGFEIGTLLKAATNLKTVLGRMYRIDRAWIIASDINNRVLNNPESIDGIDKEINHLPLVVVDYAHSPDALKQVLMALRPHCMGKLWCIFGCGGDRDRGKRPLMAKIAEQLSDKVVLTQDNPRTENPERILQEIMVGFDKPGQVYLEPDRAKAIRFAVQSAKANDLILVAGKGHETYQLIGHEKIPFDDQKMAANALAGRMSCFP